MTATATVAWLAEAGDGLRAAFFMLWQTMWALVLGFALSGAVQAFVSKEQMRRTMGTHRPAAVARASGFGMVSSSCSYAASAMAKSLFQKGADLVTAMVFMFASTNLVLELGVVLLVLLGWQFLAAEFVGGPIMIVLLALLGGLVLRGPLVERARACLARSAEGGHDHGAMAGVAEGEQSKLDAQPLGAKVRSTAAWSDAASYAMADLRMLRKELVIGFTVAGFVSVLVPVSWWNALFLPGHGVWTSLENAVVGPVIAVLSWVCSIGNVPLAAALWRGGITFGGVVAFVFADLITLPLLLIYRKYYGGRLTVRIFVLFYVVMVVAGLLVQVIFHGLGIVPQHRTGQVVPMRFAWDATAWLYTLAAAIAAGYYWLYRNRRRLGGGHGLATDPTCGMQVGVDNAPAHARHAGTDYWFCSDRCRDRFVAGHPDEAAQSPNGGSPPPDAPAATAAAGRPGPRDRGDRVP